MIRKKRVAIFLLILFLLGNFSFLFLGLFKTDYENEKTETEEAVVIKQKQDLIDPIQKTPSYNVEAKIPDFGYDFDYVVRVVASECRGEPYWGQVAVAQCILETSEKTLLTPEEVVKMKNRYASPCETQEEKDLVMDACIDVFIHGEKAFDEPIEYFYSTRGGFVSDWHENNLEYVATIGNHKFFKDR